MKKTMTRTMIAILAAVMMLMMAGCGSTKTASSSSADLSKIYVNGQQLVPSK